MFRFRVSSKVPFLCHTLKPECDFLKKNNTKNLLYLKHKGGWIISDVTTKYNILIVI